MSATPAEFELVGSREVVVQAGRYRLLFDPHRIPWYWRSDKTLACISHGHSDHTRGFGGAITKLATTATRDIYQSLGGQLRRVRSIAPGDSYSLSDDINLHIHLAGHMLGAVQFAVEKNGVRLVYTGDFNLSSTLTTDGAKPIPCDILLMEATYGRPGAVFPPRETIYAEIADWTSRILKRGKIAVFHVYATGKAQELIRLFNTYLTVPVVVDSKIATVSAVYHRHNIPLQYHAVDTPEGTEIIRQGDYVYLSAQRFNRMDFSPSQRFVRATATGWAQLYPLKNVDKAFVLSAHADFPQLIQYVQEAEPKAVFLTCGDTVTFGAVLDKLRVKRIIPHRKRQLRLSDFI